LTVPSAVLLYSAIVFVVVPLAAGTLLRLWLLKTRGREWFELSLLPRFAPLTIAALLGTLVLISRFKPAISPGDSLSF
jgi:arsenite transporter